MRDPRVWWYVFVLAFVAIAMAETFVPFRSLPSSTPRRWTSNAILQALSTTVVFCAYQLTGIELAFRLQASAYGALNRLSIPYSLRFALGFVALDLGAYTSHRLFHAFTLLWRVHQVHHSETDLDLTTGLRFHPFEALVTQGFLLALIAVLGVPPAAVAFAAMAFIVQDFFTHANLRVSQSADHFLRLLIVTPGMHRVHHSREILGQSANFGTVFSLWDRLFGTYSAGLPGGTQTGSGLAEIANGSDLNGAGLLILPFRRIPKAGS
jgi:sterol desaturase/sphingolipid hydroxylase (fatty acid hydroxylase superfamily)